MTFILFFLGFIGEVFKGQSNANNKENKQKNNHHFQTHTIEHDQDHTHVSEHQPRQVRYTSDQFI